LRFLLGIAILPPRSKHHFIAGSFRARTAVDNSSQAESKRCEGRPPRDIAGFLAIGVILTLTGCGGITAQGRNAEGVRLFQQARYQEALQEFQEAAYADPKNPDGNYNIAATYHRMGKIEHRQSDLDQAEIYYNRCLDLDDNHAECYRGLAVLLAEQGRNDEAFRLIEGWVQRQPTSANAKIELARLNEEFGNRQAAKEYLIEALAQQPDNARALTALGKIREDAGETAQALANYQRSLEHDGRQTQVAARVAALQAGTAPAGLAAPTVEMGTQVAGREKANPLR